MDNNNSTPLTEDEQAQLLHIYRTRLRLFVSVFAVLLPMAFLYSSYIDPVKVHKRKISRAYDNYTGLPKNWKPKDSDYLFTARWQAYAFNMLFLVVPITFFGVRIFKRRVICFKKDAENGVKQAIPYTIMRKTFFTTTNQYFISFDDPNYMHHEVDAHFYNNCYEGSSAYLHRAPLSKYTFNKNGSFSLM